MTGHSLSPQRRAGGAAPTNSPQSDHRPAATRATTRAQPPPFHQAPEITQRREYVGRPVDVWSLGVLLFAMVAGHFPFTAKTYPELYKKIAAAVLKMPEDFSPALADLIRRMLNPDPTKRITLAHARFHPWVTPAIPAVMGAIGAPKGRSLLISDDPATDVN